MTKGPVTKQSHHVCRNCNTEFPKNKTLVMQECPECGTYTKPPMNPMQQHVRVID